MKIHREVPAPTDGAVFSTIGYLKHQARRYPLLSKAEERRAGEDVQAAQRTLRAIRDGLPQEVQKKRRSSMRFENAQRHWFYIHWDAFFCVPGEEGQHPALVAARQTARQPLASLLAARTLLVNSNLRFVIGYVGKKYPKSPLLDDLVQEGNAALVKSADTFNPRRSSFANWAAMRIRQAIDDYVANCGECIRVPISNQKLARRVKRVRAEFKAQKRIASPQTLAWLVGSSEDDLAEIESHVARPTKSLTESFGSLEDARCYIDICSNPTSPDPERYLLDREIRDCAESLLGQIPDRLARVTRLKNGIEGGREHTDDEIGELMSFTGAWAGQLKKQAEKMLRTVADSESDVYETALKLLRA